MHRLLLLFAALTLSLTCAGATPPMRYAKEGRAYSCIVLTEGKPVQAVRIFFPDGTTAEQWFDESGPKWQLMYFQRGIWRVEHRKGHDALFITQEVMLKGNEITVIGKPRPTEYLQIGAVEGKETLLIDRNVGGGKPAQDYMRCKKIDDTSAPQKLRNIADGLLRDSADLRAKREAQVAQIDPREKEDERLRRMDPTLVRALVANEIKRAPSLQGCQLFILNGMERDQLRDSMEMEQYRQTMQRTLSHAQMKKALHDAFTPRFRLRHQQLVQFGCAKDPLQAP